MNPVLNVALEASFGGPEGWQTVAQAHASGPWRLHWQPPTATLVFDHTDTPAPDGHVPLATCPEGGRLESVDWNAAHARYQAAVTAASEAFGVTAEAVTGTFVLDVRRAAVFETSATVLPGARWRDPARVADWVDALPRHCPVTVYCVHGHELSRATALRLRAAGVDARFLRGGIDGWSGAGQPLAHRGEPA